MVVFKSNSSKDYDIIIKRKYNEAIEFDMLQFDAIYRSKELFNIFKFLAETIFEVRDIRKTLRTKWISLDKGNKSAEKESNINLNNSD